MIVCSECGRKNLDNAFICEKCGASLLKKRKPSVKKTGIGKTTGPLKVVITDINIPFGSMVTFMVKWVIASIPAIIIAALVILLFISIISGLGNFIRIFLKELLPVIKNMTTLV